MRAPALLFAHGAGAGSAHPWMRAWSSHLAGLGEVTPFDYPYMAAGRRAPDRLPKLIEAHRNQLSALRVRHDGPVVLVGKSMGSRVGCHVSVTEAVDAVVCLGYPLVGGGRKKTMRDQVLKAMTTPVMFVQGSRDPMSPLPPLNAVIAAMEAPATLHVVEGGNHSLAVGKRALAAAGESQEDVDQRTLEAIRAFLHGLGLAR